MGTRLIFHVFFTSQILKCSTSHNICPKPCRFIRGIYVLLFDITAKFQYLSPKHLYVTSSSLVPTFATFQKIRYVLIQIKVAKKQLITESSFIFVNTFQYFRETLNLLSPSCLPTNRCYSPSNTTWFGHLWTKNSAINLCCTAVSLEK